MIADGLLNSPRKLMFTSATPGWRTTFWTVLSLVAAGLVLGAALNAYGTHIDPAGAAIFLLFIASIPVMRAARRWTLEVDPVTGRLTICQQFLGCWRTTIFEGPFDECSRLGTIVYASDGDLPELYGIYVEAKRGGRVNIPFRYPTRDEAERIASELSAVTGIARLDQPPWQLRVGFPKS